MQLVETVLAAEIMGHCRSYQIQAALCLPDDANEPVMHALRESIQPELERVFSPPPTLVSASGFALASLWIAIEERDRLYNALEFLENVLKSQLRAILVPLLDGKVSPKQRATIAERFVRAKVGDREQWSPAMIPGRNPAEPMPSAGLQSSLWK